MYFPWDASRTVEVLAVKVMGLFLFHLCCIFKYCCTCKNCAHLIYYHSFITSFQFFFFFCMLPARFKFITGFQNLVFVLIYLNTLLRFPLRSTWSAFSPTLSLTPLLHLALFFNSLSPFHLLFHLILHCQLYLCPLTPPVLQGLFRNLWVQITELCSWSCGEDQLCKQYSTTMHKRTSSSGQKTWIGKPKMLFWKCNS